MGPHNAEVTWRPKTFSTYSWESDSIEIHGPATFSVLVRRKVGRTGRKEVPPLSTVAHPPTPQPPPLHPTQLSPLIVLNQAGFEKGSGASPLFFFGQLIKITHKRGSPVMRGLLKRGSFRLLCLSRGNLRLCQRNWSQMATQSGPPVRSAYGAISKDRAISSTSPLYRPQHPPGPTRCRDKCVRGGLGLLHLPSCRFSPTLTII